MGPKICCYGKVAVEHGRSYEVLHIGEIGCLPPYEREHRPSQRVSPRRERALVCEERAEANKLPFLSGLKVPIFFLFCFLGSFVGVVFF